MEAVGTDCRRHAGPWHGLYFCRAHFRYEAWSRGRLAAWLAGECSEQTLPFWLDHIGFRQW